MTKNPIKNTTISINLFHFKEKMKIFNEKFHINCEIDEDDNADNDDTDADPDYCDPERDGMLIIYL